MSDRFDRFELAKAALENKNKVKRSIYRNWLNRQANVVEGVGAPESYKRGRTAVKSIPRGFVSMMAEKLNSPEGSRASSPISNARRSRRARKARKSRRARKSQRRATARRNRK